ncbi:hypothetical protein NDU88_008393 [Pleurodeles waltl]|uniref:Uncharacterized protein n=1 Tax=Pleurodeles waltl TaxID=8319 RepID=A0AAV7RTN7_PLEWA|nr:hypothetical protein NDU88_008393 [Pleurodeles waltl]
MKPRRRNAEAISFHIAFKMCRSSTGSLSSGRARRPRRQKGNVESRSVVMPMPRYSKRWPNRGKRKGRCGRAQRHIQYVIHLCLITTGSLFLHIVFWVREHEIRF